MVDICQEGHSQRSAAQRRHTAYLRQCSHGAPRKPSGWDQGVIRGTAHLGRVHSLITWSPELLRLGRAQNPGPDESVPLWSTREPEPQWLRPGKCMQPRACFRQFPCRATWSLISVDQESTHAVTRGKPSVAQTLRALPTHASDVCLQYSTLPTAQRNK